MSLINEKTLSFEFDVKTSHDEYIILRNTELYLKLRTVFDKKEEEGLEKADI